MTRRSWNNGAVGLAASLALAGLCGCEAVDAEGDELGQSPAAVLDGRPEGVTLFEPLLLEVPAPAASAGCADWRWIGYRNRYQTSCPVPPSPTKWVVSSVFGTAGNTSPTLKRFCSYEHREAGVPDIAALQLLYKAGKLDELGRDCLAVTPLGAEPLEEATAADLVSLFKRHAGKPTVVGNGTKPTRLAIIDDLPTRSTAAHPERMSAAARTSEHGYAMANLATDLTCTGATCGAEVSSQLAIQYTGFDKTNYLGATRNAVVGGSVGMLGDLASAVVNEIAAFQAATDHNGHMVMNLSLGWREQFGGEGAYSDMPAPVQAVYAALEYASCKNLIVVVAAGNKVFGPDPEEGPWYPAGWESYGAPLSALCTSRHAVANNVPTSSVTNVLHRPLVYSVGGLSAAGRLHGADAEDGTPRLVAYAEHAASLGRPDGAFTTPMTGTSVSAVVVSSAAALAWYYRPTLRSDVLMDLLYVNDTEIAAKPAGTYNWALPSVAYTSDYGRSPGSPVRRVDVCQTLRVACENGAATAGTCPAPTSFACAPWTPGLPSLPGLYKTEFRKTLLKDDLDFEEYLDPSTSPAEFAYDIQDAPWLHTQPGKHPCPGCVISASTGEAFLAIVNPYAVTISKPTLYIGSVPYSLGNTVTVTPGATRYVTNPAFLEAVSFTASTPVSISVRVGTTVASPSATGPVLVVP